MKQCPINGCECQIKDDYLMCSKHLKLVSRATQNDYYGAVKQVQAGELPIKELIAIEKKAVNEAASEVAYRKEFTRRTIERLRLSLA